MKDLQVGDYITIAELHIRNYEFRFFWHSEECWANEENHIFLDSSTGKIKTILPKN